jgi:hypothetical protein
MIESTWQSDLHEGPYRCTLTVIKLQVMYVESKESVGSDGLDLRQEQFGSLTWVRSSRFCMSLAYPLSPTRSSFEQTTRAVTDKIVTYLHNDTI